MATVSLRTYSQEIENLVDRGQLDEAIAHCRHVLNTFPKYLETYRLIGKAYLEAKRYDEAIDIFERLLLSVPDDFVAHVGMSIIHDERNDLDAAIWYMQRAFEVQPSNAAIQSELQRLYGRRDGVEPSKVRLTRGALAHMYVQGQLYPQAISEIQSVLENDAERHDMQVLLARAYFHAGRKSEAAEICSQLLKGYPYCLDANRVLAELLPETEQSENVKTYRQRVFEMDPYAAYATGSVFLTEEVPDAAVSLERLEWDGQSVDLGPEWGESRGMGRDESAVAGDEEPDWLKPDLTQEPEPDSVPTGEAAPISEVSPEPGEGEEDDIPDFLREAGWSESSGAFQEGPDTFEASGDTSEEPELAEGDLPDWVKAMAPTGVDAEGATPPVEPGEDLTKDDVPDWLQGLEDVQDAPSVDEQPLMTEEELPDWLESKKPPEEAEPKAEEQPVAAAASDDELPDWLETQQPEDEQAVPQEATPEPEPTAETPAPVAMDVDQPPPGEEALPGPVDAAKVDTGDLGASADEQNDAIAWLEGLAAKHGAKPEELVTDPEARKETEPDWVQQAKGAKGVSDEEPPVVEEEPLEESAPPAATPSEEVEEAVEPTVEKPAAAVDATTPGDLGTSAEEQEDAIAWLEGLASKQGAKPEELVTDPEARKEMAPDWVQQAKEAGVEEPPDEIEPQPPVGEETAPEQPVSEEPADEPAPSIETDEIGAWLQDLDEESSEDGDQVAQPETEGDFTEWLSGLDAEDSEESAVPETEEVPEMETAPEAEAAPEPDGEPEAELPEWLHSMEAESATPEPTPESEPEGETPLPDWLSDAETETTQEESLPAATEEPLSEPLQEEDGKIDINSASLEQLAELPGIGDMLAQTIVAHRETYGDFSSIDDLSNIAGIGPSTVEDLQGQVEVRKVEAAAQADEPGVTDWLREKARAEGVPAEETGDEDLPSWLADLDSDVEEKPADEPADEDQDLPEWLQAESEDAASQPEPTTSKDWQPVEAAKPDQVEAEEPAAQAEEEVVPEPVVEAPAPETVEPEPEPEPEAPAPEPVEPEPEPEPAPAEREGVTTSRTETTGTLSDVQNPDFTEAQNELTRGNIPAAMEKYGKLIKKGKMLDEIIFDLREALYRYPVEVIILQTLGDAYMRANRLQEALDAYTKAEELLR